MSTTSFILSYSGNVSIYYKSENLDEKVHVTGPID